MILLAPNTLRNDLGIHSSSMQSHLSRCHNLHLELKAQCEPAENTVLICWIIRQMLLFGTSSKDTCWQLALKGQWHLLDTLQRAQRQNLILAEVKESFAIDLNYARISVTIAHDLYVLSTRLWVVHEIFIHRQISVVSNNGDAEIPKEYY